MNINNPSDSPLPLAAWFLSCPLMAGEGGRESASRGGGGEGIARRPALPLLLDVHRMFDSRGRARENDPPAPFSPCPAPIFSTWSPGGQVLSMGAGRGVEGWGDIRSCISSSGKSVYQDRRPSTRILQTPPLPWQPKKNLVWSTFWLWGFLGQSFPSFCLFWGMAVHKLWQSILSISVFG